MTEHLDDQTMVDLVEGRVDDAERAKIEAHASRCEDCRALLSALARDEPGVAETIEAPIRPSKIDVGTKIGRYLVKRMLGAGGMGMVYAAHDPELDRGVAIKLLHHGANEQMQNRLKREAQLVAQLAHPNVVAVYDVGAFAGRIFVAMEYVDGETLAKWLAAKPRTHAEILAMFEAAGRGLAAAHAEGLVHRDFKPENCVIGEDGRLRVLDFGLALAVGEGAARTPLPSIIARAIRDAGASAPLDLTRTGTMIGTPYYMSPEQYRGEDADARSDQFSFCVALYSALYEQRPFRGETFEELAETVLAGKVAPPPKGTRVKPWVREAIARGLSHEPAARFPTMSALLAALQPPKRSKLRWIVPVGLALGSGVAIVAATRSSTAVAPPPARCAELATLATEIDAASGSPSVGSSSVGSSSLRSWRAAHAMACQPGAIAHEGMLDCLANRLRGMAEAKRLLGENTVEYRVSAIHVARALPSIESCALVDDPIGDAASKRRAREVRQRIAEIDVQLAAGDYERASRAVAPLATDAGTIDPVLAGEVVELATRIADARPSLGYGPPTLIPSDSVTKNLDAAEKALVGDDRATFALRARLAVDRIAHLGKLGRFQEVWWSRPDALSAIADARTREALTEADASNLRATVIAKVAEAEAAVQHHADAMVDFEAALVLSDDPEAHAHIALAAARSEARLGRADAARARVTAAISELVTIFGEDHVEIGLAHEQLAMIERERRIDRDGSGNGGGDGLGNGDSSGNGSGNGIGDNLDDAIAELATAEAIYAKQLGLANRWRGAALATHAELLGRLGRAKDALAAWQEVDRIDEALGYRDALASANQYRLARAYLPIDREQAYRTLTRPIRTTSIPAPPSRAYLRPMRQSFVEQIDRAAILVELAYAMPLATTSEPPLPSAQTLFTMAKSAIESARNLRGSTVFTSGPFLIDLDNPWREDYLMGEVLIGLGKLPEAIAALENAKRLAPGDTSAIDAALGRAKNDRAMVTATLDRLEPYARERARKWLDRK